MATIRDRGRVRKERFESRAFRFAIEDESRAIDVLIRHDFGKPIASRKAGSLVIKDGADGVTFEARLPDDPPSWVVDAERAIAAGLMTGLSPGFTVPPTSAVPDAERLEPEPGNSGVQIRVIREAVLREFFIVTSAAHTSRRSIFGPRTSRQPREGGGYGFSNSVALADNAKRDRDSATASALVERYAPAAPQPVRNEAVIRTSDWLIEQPAGSISNETQGDIRTGYAPSMTGALRHSGAMALLSPWKIRRAGAVG